MVFLRMATHKESAVRRAAGREGREAGREGRERGEKDRQFACWSLVVSSLMVSAKAVDQQ